MNLAKFKILAGLRSKERQLNASIYKEYTQIKTNIIKKAFNDFELFFEDQGFKVINNNGTKRTVKFFDLEIEIQLIESEPTEADALFKLIVSEPETSVDILLMNKAPGFSPKNQGNSVDSEIDVCKQQIAYSSKHLSKEEWYYTYEDGGPEFRSLKSLLVKMFEVK